MNNVIIYIFYVFYKVIYVFYFLDILKEAFKNNHVEDIFKILLIKAGVIKRIIGTIALHTVISAYSTVSAFYTVLR